MHKLHDADWSYRKLIGEPSILHFKSFALTVTLSDFLYHVPGLRRLLFCGDKFQENILYM